MIICYRMKGLFENFNGATGFFLFDHVIMSRLIHLPLTDFQFVADTYTITIILCYCSIVFDRTNGNY